MRILPAALACTAALLFARLASAEPLAPATLPANTQWVIHLDLDTARDTSLWQFLREKFFAQPTAQDRIQAVENFTGMKFPDDLHDVTLYGPSYAKDDAAVLIHAAVNQAQITDLLKQNPDFATTPHNDHDILTWRDNGQDRLLYGAFFAQDRIIIAPTEKLVADALDALDKKIEVLKPASPLLGGLAAAGDKPASGAAAPDDPKGGVSKTPHPVAYLAGLHLAQLQKNKNAVSPIIAQADAGWITISENDKKITATAAVFAKSDKAARQVLVIAQGLKAALDLSASDDAAAPPAAKIASTLLENLTLRRDGQKMIAELPLSLEAIQHALDASHNRPKPAANPTTAP